MTDRQGLTRLTTGLGTLFIEAYMPAYAGTTANGRETTISVSNATATKATEKPPDNRPVQRQPTPAICMRRVLFMWGKPTR
jgi:hypothetical protein